MLTVALELASKSCKTHNVKSMTEAGVVTGSKWLLCVELPSVVNTLQILLTQECLSNASKFSLWDTAPKG